MNMRRKILSIHLDIKIYNYSFLKLNQIIFEFEKIKNNIATLPP